MCITRASYIEGKDKPVTVYKVIECHIVAKEDDQESTELMITRKTPFRGVILSKDILNGTVPFVAQGYSDIVGEYQDNTGKKYAKKINGGFIHTYATKQSVVKDYFQFYRPECEKVYEKERVEVEIYECEIPAGEGYWEGLFEFIESTASKSIVFKRRLPQEEIEMTRMTRH